MKFKIFILVALATFTLSIPKANSANIGAFPENNNTVFDSTEYSISPDQSGTPMRVKVTIINLIGIKLSPCLLSPIAEVEIYQDLNNSNGDIRQVQYLCPQDRSEIIYVKTGQKITVEANLLGRDLFFDKEVIIDSSMISANGIIDISFTVDIEL